MSSIDLALGLTSGLFAAGLFLCAIKVADRLASDAS
jgi:hypothetical protein